MSARVVVSGLAATYPFGGVFWDYLQYVIGLHQLGCDVLYLEDTGKWCYEPASQTFVERGEANARHLARQIERIAPELAERWHYFDGTQTSFGMPREEALRFCRRADLFIHLSASCLMRDDYFEADRVAFIDSDPMYTQAKYAPLLAGDSLDDDEADRIAEHIAWLRRHDVFFTFGENFGAGDCTMPVGAFDWRPTRQPIVIDLFAGARAPLRQRRRVFTTVASWEPHETGPVVNGTRYTGKSTEFLRLVDLPRRVRLPIELALSGAAPRGRLEDCGWELVDARSHSRDPIVYRDYLARSFAEFSVAKHAYVASRSGWFSGRSACYLALGVPVVVQDTGFGHIIPTGEGVVAFATADEAVAAIESVVADPRRHGEAALDIAAEHFDSRRVLTALLETALNGSHAAHESAESTVRAKREAI